MTTKKRTSTVKKKRATKKKSKATKSRTKKKAGRKSSNKLRIQSKDYAWEGAFPYIVETYKVNDETITVGQYIPNDHPEFELFLFNSIRKSTLPKWIKSNLTKIRKRIRDELRHRAKLDEKLSKEQKYAICLFFEDSEFFERSEDSEFFEYELEKAIISFLRAILDTSNYQTFVRQGLRNRNKILSKYGGL